MRVILHADDLGLSVQVNEAIFQAISAGWCTSTSLLANGPAFDHAVAGLRRLGPVDLGVHLNLSEFAPLTDGPGLRALFPDGVLDSRAINAEWRHAPAIRAEWEAQLRRVLAAGFEVTHLDSHQHLHWRPVCFGVICGLHREFGVHGLRGRGAFRPDADRLRRWLEARRAARFRAAVRASGAVTTDGFGSVSVFRVVGQRCGLSSFEVMLHPGNPAHARYAEECVWLADGEWRTWGAQPVGWRQLL